MCDPQDPFCAQVHHPKRRPCQTQRCQQRRHSTRPHQQAHHRHRHQVCQQTIIGNAVKGRCCKGRRGEPRQHRGCHQHRRQLHPPGQPRLQPALHWAKARDQCDGCGERQLEPRFGQPLGLDQQQDRRRQRHRPKAERPAIQQRSAEHHRHHQERPCGRHIGA